MKLIPSSMRVVLLVAIFCLNVGLDAYADTDIEEAKTCLLPDSDNRIDCLLRLVLNKRPTLFRKLAQEGNQNYQYLLGRAYEGGVVGAPQEYGEAVRWYRKSAIQGNGMAQMALGMMYFDGEGRHKKSSGCIHMVETFSGPGRATRAGNFWNNV
jgi:hypothetical protein